MSHGRRAKPDDHDPCILAFPMLMSQSGPSPDGFQARQGFCPAPGLISRERQGQAQPPMAYR